MREICLAYVRQNIFNGFQKRIHMSGMQDFFSQCRGLFLWSDIGVAALVEDELAR